MAIMDSFSILDISIFVLFITAVVLVGLIKSRGEDGSEGYFLAGRGLSWWLIGLSLIAANISTEQFVGMTGSASGISGLAIASYEWMAAITLVFMAFFFLPIFLKSGIYTVPQFLEFRFNSFSRTVMSMMIIIVLVLVNTTAVIYSGATVTETVLGEGAKAIDLTTACWAIGVMAAVYVCAGGLKACAWADLLQGTALIVGGALIAYFAFDAFAAKDVADITTTAVISQDKLASVANAGVFEKFFALNSDKLTMFMPSDHKEIPWTALLIGLWIPNFYYWGFNQYIIQRTLGASSLAEGQKGIMFAAGLKLIIPFIIVIPGIMAFNLYAPEQRDAAQKDQKIMSTNAKAYSVIYFDWLDKQKQEFDANKAVNVFKYIKVDDKNVATEAPILTVEEVKTLHNDYKKIKSEGNLNKITFKYDNGWAQANAALIDGKLSRKDLVDAWNTANKDTADKQFTKSLYGYKYDYAFGLLIKKVLPEGFGLRGFIFAALLGAVVSSLAAMLNAASTMFTLDIYKKFVRTSASDKEQVIVGRITVLIFAVIGCLVAPLLANPKLGGVFTFIQEFQGFISPGVLAVFIFGMFSKKTPRCAGALGIIVGVITYGVLLFACSDVAFLNRMAITFACVVLVMLSLTIFKPLKEAVVLPENKAMNLTSSIGAKTAGITVLATAIVFYVIFSGLWF